MTDTGFKFSGTQTNTAAGHTGTNPTFGTLANVNASDNTYLTISHGSGSNTSDYLHFTNFDMSGIPSGALIVGVEVTIERKAGTANRLKDEVIQLVIGNTHQGTSLPDSAFWPLVESTITYGGPTTLWGLTPTYTDVVTNQASFGVAVKTTNGGNGTVVGSIDAIQLKVYYTAGDVNVTLTGVAATGAAGDFSITGDGNVTLTGAAGTGAAGDITVNLNQPVSIDGVQAAGSAGTITVTGDANVTLAGATATGSAGTITARTDVDVALTGVEAVGQAGDITVNLQLDVPVPGVAATGSAGTIAPTGDANVTLTGVQAVGSAGTIAPTADANVTLDGVQAVGQAGLIDGQGDTSVDVSVTLGGVSAAGQAGDITVTAEQLHRHIGGGIPLPWPPAQWDEQGVRPEPFDREKALQDIQRKVIDELLPKPEEPVAFDQVKKVDDLFTQVQKVRKKPIKILPADTIPAAETVDKFVMDSVVAQQFLDDMVAIALLM